MMADISYSSELIELSFEDELKPHEELEPKEDHKEQEEHLEEEPRPWEVDHDKEDSNTDRTDNDFDSYEENDESSGLDYEPT